MLADLYRTYWGVMRLPTDQGDLHIVNVLMPTRKYTLVA